MGELGDVLELMHGARGRWRTARFVARDWTDTALSQAAHERLMERQGGGCFGGSLFQFTLSPMSGAEEEPPEATVKTSRDWAEGRKYRAETEWQGQAQRSTVVCDGERLWHRSAGMGAIVNDAQNTTSGWEPILDPRGLLGSGDLEPAGHREVLGRDALVLTGRVVAEEPLRHVDGLHLGTTDFELLVDAERGVVLRTEERLDGRPFHVRELLEVAFDEPFPESTFVYQPPPGETVRTPEEAFRTQHLTVDEVARRASFQVWVPGALADGWRAQAIYNPAGDLAPAVEIVHLVYAHERGTHTFQLQETEAGSPVPEEFERVKRDGIEAAVHVPEGRRMPTVVVLDRDGTRIQLSSSELGRDELLDLAFSLVPAPTEPPDLLA